MAATVDLPLPIPPVSPMVYMRAVKVTDRQPSYKRNHAIARSSRPARIASMIGEYDKIDAVGTQRITITLPSQTLDRIRKEAREKRRPVSQIIADALHQEEEGRRRERMIEGYKATREENLRFAEEALPLALETWPSD